LEYFTLLIPEFLLILHIDGSMICIFNGNFNVDRAVRPLSKRVVAIPNDAITSAIIFRGRMVVKISKMIKALLVSPANLGNTNRHFGV